jgi:[glutamine synthetase] adenylyltransferase / [glutamine synthetase]-adenylyl-L-tyrosine phosphorylase
LQLKGLLPSLQQLQLEALISAQMHNELEQAYLFLRKLENRVQMLNDAQVHHLPDSMLSKQRIALGLGYVDNQQMLDTLNSHRGNVQRLFSSLLNESTESSVANENQNCGIDFSASSLQQQGFIRVEQHAERLQALQASSAVAALNDRSQQRLMRVLHGFLSACRAATHTDQCLHHAISFMQAILRRGSYIALLDEQRTALARVVQVFDESQWLSQLLIDYPLLLDELLDSRVINQQINTLDLNTQLAEVLSHHNNDVEMSLLALNEFKISYTFKIAYQFLFNALPGNQVSSLLTRLAECILQHCNSLASQELQRQHGRIAGANFAIIGYGSLGARSLAFNSDLDLVFLNQTAAQQSSDGQRPIDSARFFLRYAQKLISLLGLSTPSGSLYEVDIRLRPDGAKGLLVSTMESFEQYQQQRAWVWEMQALVRARAVAGDDVLCQYFEQTRHELISVEREKSILLHEITAMRKRMRGELDRSNDTHFDLKHGMGGLTDIEFFLQAHILLHACHHNMLANEREALAIIEQLQRVGIIESEQAKTLSYAYEYLLSLGLRCHLNNAPRVVERTAELQSITSQVFVVLLEYHCAVD